MEALVGLLVWGIMIYGWVVLARGAKKVLTDNPEVRDAAKAAATRKAIGTIAKWLK
jgi:hypothetical protein